MVAGLASSYGVFTWIAGRFLYPARPSPRSWQFVTEANKLEVGDALLYRGPSGETINIARQARAGAEGDFVALSSTCPHLGCQVHWEAHNDRFFCPCHNGVFDPAGRGIGGPPGEAKLSLPRYPLKVESGLLYIEVPVTSLHAAGRVIDCVPGIHGPGHDPCLSRALSSADSDRA
jgi:nitrite reductase/ring-hydroxylating ferredoxin subunit